ncbi:MAG: hypothetical protein AAF514_15690, partial [Verrucomicrobiota bacterium]
AYRLSHLGEELDLFAYARNDSEGAKILNSLLELQPRMGAILKLRFRSNPYEGDQGENTDIVQDNWFKERTQ